MKKIKNFRKQILLLLVCALSMPAFSQGIAIYKKDGTMIKCAYEEIDSIVAYNYGETPVTPPAETQYEAVDLGLPSGIKWATCNVGATKPEEFGGYYAWGETEEKDDYSWGTYKWCNGSSTTMTKYCIDSSYGTVDNKTVLDLEDDVAHVKWGGSWRMPTRAEQEELRNNCTWTWTTQNAVNGYKVTSKTNGNSIFLVLPLQFGSPRQWQLRRLLDEFVGRKQQRPRLLLLLHQRSLLLGLRLPLRRLLCAPCVWRMAKTHRHSQQRR